MRFFNLALLAALFAIACLEMFGQRHHAYWGDDPVASDTHWVLAGQNTTVRLSLRCRPPIPNVLLAGVAQANCSIVEQSSHGAFLYVTLRPVAAGAVKLRLEVRERQQQ